MLPLILYAYFNARFLFLLNCIKDVYLGDNLFSFMSTLMFLRVTASKLTAPVADFTLFWFGVIRVSDVEGYSTFFTMSC